MANIARSGPLTEGMYKELWKACAGPLAYVPCEGERVYYFPQGHLEQLNVPMHDGVEKQLSSFCLPAKIVCKVMNVQLLVNPGTDELYANITLLPDDDQSEVTIADPTLAEPSSCAVRLFCKTFTEAETRTHEGYYFLHNQAPLDMSKHPPSKQVVATDLHGTEWRFHYIFQGKAESHILDAGGSAFVRANKCINGAGFVLLSGENGEMYVGVKRRLILADSLLPTSVISYIQRVFLSVASNAVTTRTRFSVVYKPRRCLSSFIISVNKYLEGKNYTIPVGMRFTMTFEDEKFAERRFAGTVVGVEDSEWKSIQVEWDEMSSAMLLPDKVSFWELECSKRSVWTSCLKKFKNMFCWACFLSV